MKKAYVKPVLVAEPYEMTETVAWCEASQYVGVNVYVGVSLCVSQNCHTVKKGEIFDGNYSYTDANNTTQTMTYWQYAGGQNCTGTQSTSLDVFLFSTGNTACDFLWSDPDEQIFVWKTPEVSGRTEGNWKTTGKYFTEFFYNNDSFNSTEHQPGITLGRFFS